jgi:tripartite-type tricarboxylate transporter receptor subunit TctC
MLGRKLAYPSRREILRSAGLAIGALVAPNLGLKPASAAGYPEHPVKIIVPFAPAGPTDIMARILSTHLGEAIGGTVIVENKAGAGGNIGIGAAAHADPDGYTLLVTSSAYVVNPGLYAKIPYDPYKDFAPIAELGTSPNVFLVNPKLGVSTMAELIARAKADPNELNYASPGIGTTPHLSAELLKIVGGIQITHVPFSGAGPAIQAVLGGITQVCCAALPPAHPQIESGALKALAVTGAQRWFDLPDVPTMVELGFKTSSPTRSRVLWRRPGRRRPSSKCCRRSRSKFSRRLRLPSSCATMASRSSPTGLMACESASRTRCRNGATSSLRPASSRCDRNTTKILEKKRFLGNAHGQTTDRYLRAAAERRAGRSAGPSPGDPVQRPSAEPAAHARLL